MVKAAPATFVIVNCETPFGAMETKVDFRDRLPGGIRCAAKVGGDAGG